MGWEAKQTLTRSQFRLWSSFLASVKAGFSFFLGRWIGAVEVTGLPKTLFKTGSSFITPGDLFNRRWLVLLIWSSIGGTTVGDIFKAFFTMPGRCVWALKTNIYTLLHYLTIEIKFWKTLYNTLTNGSTMPVPVRTPKLRQKWRAARQVVAFLRPQKSMQAELQPTIRTAITTPKAPYVASVLNWKERRQLHITK